MKYYNVENKLLNKDYLEKYYICNCNKKPNNNTHILSINCKRMCDNFISNGEDEKGIWIECKHYNLEIRKEKLKRLKEHDRKANV